MVRRQKTFLLVAVPFFVVTVLLSVVSMTAAVVVTMTGLLAFGLAFTRPMGRSLALMPCVFCSRKIIFEHEGEFCPTCKEPIHAKCMGEHAMSAHAPSKDQPFR